MICVACWEPIGASPSPFFCWDCRGLILWRFFTGAHRRKRERWNRRMREMIQETIRAEIFPQLGIPSDGPIFIEPFSPTEQMIEEQRRAWP